MSVKSLRTIAVGDVHGELDALKEILQHASMTDGNNHWAAGTDTLVQMGDVIDRGPKSKQSYSFLGRLQREAAETGGRVVRLLGNHELALLTGDEHWTNFSDPQSLGRKLKADVLAGAIQGAFAQHGYLFTHAGLRSDIRQHLLGTRSILQSVEATEILADRINDVLLQAVATGNFSDPCFFIGPARGGRCPVGGTYWTDATEELHCSDHADAIRQIVGHTPQHEITAGPSGRIINIDVGIYYFGGRAYLEIRDGEVTPVDCRNRGHDLNDG